MTEEQETKVKEKEAKPDDLITRYIYSKDHIKNNIVKYGAYIPPNDYPNEISVDVITHTSEQIIWERGKEIRVDKLLVGRGDMVVGQVTMINDEQGDLLKVLIDGKPHPDHANVKNIPLDKAKRKEVAVRLANISNGKLLEV